MHIQTEEFDFYLDSFLIPFQARALEKVVPYSEYMTASAHFNFGYSGQGENQICAIF